MSPLKTEPSHSPDSGRLVGFLLFLGLILMPIAVWTTVPRAEPLAQTCQHLGAANVPTCEQELTDLPLPFARAAAPDVRVPLHEASCKRIGSGDPEGCLNKLLAADEKEVERNRTVERLMKAAL